MRKIVKYMGLVAGLLASVHIKAQKAAPIVVQVNEIRAPVSPTMYGIFFEDINFAADGGLYAELVKNRSFEFAEPLMGWDIRIRDNADGNLLIINRGPAYDVNPRFARVTVNNDTEVLAITNEGFRGMGIRKGEEYDFSLMAKMQDGKESALTIEILDENDQLLGKTYLTINSMQWRPFHASLVASGTSKKAKLKLSFTKKAVTDVDMISLFPKNTWMGRPGGLRKDLVQMLADLKPGFIRFPGGCIVEGRDLANRYQWKNTVGDISNRKLIMNRWNVEFKNRPAKDYFQSFGLGFYEYFLLADDLGAEPLPILNCGMACQYNSAEVAPLETLDPYIRDALDLVEFANGPVDTHWGKLRAAMGHPAPFHLKMMGVGNEQWGPQYVERYKIFAKAIHDRYPEIKLISSVGPHAGGALFDYLLPEMTALKADIIDEHYYMPPSFFQDNARRYDHYDRNSPKIFAGEYAAHVKGKEGPEKSSWQAALSEAAFMTGLERNADIVVMSSYAPLLAHVDAWQWAPDLVWFDNLQHYGTPSYYVQQLFSNNKGTDVVSIQQAKQVIAGQDSLYATAVIDKVSKELIIKIVNTSSSEKQQDIALEGIRKIGPDMKVVTLRSGDLDAVNSIQSPENLAPVETLVKINGKKFSLVLPPYSFHVLRLNMY
ncbi:MAG: alpha-L-arabinofuranosidase [Terrimonas sp.]|nr:alpha-L-arabinofuranosidase [Terrimonas sp.]